MLKNNKGVTLVELLIVIVILGIIAAIAIPAVGNIVDNAQRDAVIADAQNIRSAAQLGCTSEGDTWSDECSDQIGREDVAFLRNSGDSGDPGTSMADYIEGLGANAYVAVRVDGTWIIAISTDNWSFVGDPTDASRDDVIKSGDDGYWDGSSAPTTNTETDTVEFDVVGDENVIIPEPDASTE